MVYPIGILAALLLGVGYVLQQRVAANAPDDDLLHWRLLLDLMRRPLWWGGIGCMVAGQLLSGLALQVATVALVEPLLSTNLLFALALAATLAGGRPQWHELGGAAMLSAALGVFIAVGRPHSSPAPEPNRAVVVLAVMVLVAVVGVCVLIGRRKRPVVEAIWLSSGAGLLFGLQDVATREVLVRFDDRGALATLGSVWSYLLLAAAVVGILLAQSAFKAARLDWSLPPITAAEPVAGIALGILLLGDVVSVSTLGLAVESACLVVMVAGVALIGRSRSLASCAAPVEAVAAAGAAPPVAAAMHRHRGLAGHRDHAA